MAYHRAILNGEDVSDFHFKGEITEPHEGFKKWMKKNRERIENAQSLPYWVRDNGKYVGAKGKTEIPGIKSEKSKPSTVDDKNKTDGTIEQPKTPNPSQKTSAPPPDLVTTADANLIAECDAHRQIMGAQTYKELEEYMTKNGIATKLDLSSMPIDMAREVCATWAQIQHDWNLPPIEITTDKLGDKTFGRGNGERIILNRKTFGGNASLNIRIVYKKNVSRFIDRRKKDIDKWKKRSELYQGYIEKAEKRGDKVTANSYRKYKKDLDKSIQKKEGLIEGHTRHNVFLSEESMLRNLVQHESGHVVADRLLGMANADTFLLKERLTSVEIKQMDDEITGLFKKYKSNGGWLSVYGMENKKEFMSECMVLYSERGGEGLPKDVKDWFDKLKAMSLREKS